MNIFVFDLNSEAAARDHCDRYVCHMPKEYAQLLASAHRVLDGVEGDIIHPSKGTWIRGYKYCLKEELNTGLTVCPLLTHQNHPCAKWVRECASNYRWLMRLYRAVGHHYYIRYGQHHKPPRYLAHMRHFDFLRYAPKNIPREPRVQTPWPNCVSDELKEKYGDRIRDYSICESYQEYFRDHKSEKLHRWDKGRYTPRWMKTNKGTE